MSKIKLLSFVLCLSLLLTPALASCKDTEKEVAETDAATDTTAADTANYVYTDKQMKYTLVYPDGASSDVVNAAKTFESTFKNHVDTKNFCGTDKAITATDGMKEILLGKTNRPQSEQLQGTLTGDMYSVKTVDGNVVICATQEWMLPDALEAFMKQIEYSKDRKSATLPESIDISYTYDGYTRDRWSLNFPAFEGGVLSQAAYTSNYGIDTMKSSKSGNYKVILANSTNETELGAYLDKVKAEGYTVTQVKSATADEAISSYWITKGDDRMYVYHSVNAGEIRFICDKGESMSTEDFSYSYTKTDTDTTTLYQYGLTFSDDGSDISKNGKTSNCGQFFVMKLADDSVIIIDGGTYYQMPENAAAELNRFLRTITGVADGEKVRIADWHITHAHGDHYSGFARFLMNYHEGYELERMSYNFNYREEIMAEFFNDYLKVWYEDVKYYRPHTGESIQLADVTMDFLYTYEDSISTETGALIPDKLPLNWGGEPKVDQNNSSTVVRITFDGKTLLLMGDGALVAQDVLLENYSDTALKCDILQASHHGLNPLDKLYAKVKPSISLYTQKKEAAPVLNALSNGVYQSIIQNTEGGIDNIYFEGNCTVGITVNSDGSFARDTESFPIVTGPWDGEDMFHIYQQNQ